MTKPQLRIGLIGTGFMGKAHALGFAAAPRVFDLTHDLVLHTVADVTEAAASSAARAYGFAHHTTDWHSIMADPAIDLVSITAPKRAAGWICSVQIRTLCEIILNQWVGFWKLTRWKGLASGSRAKGRWLSRRHDRHLFRARVKMR